MPEYENISSSVWATAWAELYKLYGERLDQENLDIMDSVLGAVTADMQDEIQRFKENEILKRYPHLATKEGDEDALEM